MSADERKNRKPRRIPVNDLDEKQEKKQPALPGQGEVSATAGNGARGEAGENRPRGEAGEGSRPPEETSAESQADGRASPRGEADLRSRVAELEDRWKRAAAELDNYRKRFDRELARLRQAEREAILREWLPVVDNMERALCAQGAAENPWYEGMEAIYQQMLEVLARFGVRPYVPQGEMFDPRLHEAVAAANLPGEPEGKIVEVVQTGYLLDGKVLRPAKVIAVKRSEE